MRDAESRREEFIRLLGRLTEDQARAFLVAARRICKDSEARHG